MFGSSWAAFVFYGLIWDSHFVFQCNLKKPEALAGI